MPIFPKFPNQDLLPEKYRSLKSVLLWKGSGKYIRSSANDIFDRKNDLVSLNALVSFALSPTFRLSFILISSNFRPSQNLQPLHLANILKLKGNFISSISRPFGIISFMKVMKIFCQSLIYIQVQFHLSNRILVSTASFFLQEILISQLLKENTSYISNSN